MLIPCLGDLVVLGCIRLARNAGTAHVPRFRRADHSDRRAAMAADALFVVGERSSEPRGYRGCDLAAIALQEFANVFVESNWRKAHGDLLQSRQIFRSHEQTYGSSLRTPDTDPVPGKLRRRFNIHPECIPARAVRGRSLSERTLRPRLLSEPASFGAAW